MALYPSLEDMKFDGMAKAQVHTYNQAVQQTQDIKHNEVLYPSLKDYMGLELTDAVIAAHMPETSVALPASNGIQHGQLIAPLSGTSVGLMRAKCTNGVRQLILCKDAENKVGVRVKAIDNGVFVCLVVDQSPAAMAGLRFGDQILQINGENLAGFTMEKVHDILKKCPVNGIAMVIRDRPFERTITLHKDSTGHVGCLFKNGRITSIVKDSSAARNGLLINHHILEIEGINVVGCKDKQITKLISDAMDVVTMTVIPSFIYDHMIKKMSSSLLKNMMDHSVLNI